MRRWIRVVVVGLMLAAVAVAGYGWFWFTSRFSSAPGDLARAKDEAARVGIDLSPAALRGPAVPASENAFPLYEQLGRALRAHPDREPAGRLWPLSPGPTSAAEQAEIRRQVESQAPQIALAEQAARRPTFQPYVDYRQGEDVKLPWFGALRGGARLISLKARYLAGRGRWQEAVDEESLCFRIADQSGRDPLGLIGYLVGGAADQIACSGMDGILRLSNGDPATADQVRRVVGEHRPRLNFRRALVHDAGAMYYTMMKARHDCETHPMAEVIGRLSGNDEASKGFHLRPTFLQVAGAQRYLTAGTTAMLQRYVRMVAASDLPVVQQRRFFEAEAASLEERTDPAKAGMGAVLDPGLLLGTIFNPTYDGMADAGFRARAAESVVTAGAAVVAYRVRHGAFPERLGAVGTVPPDPFIGRALGYRREPGGFVVYSVGETGRFDGGRPGHEVSTREALFRWPVEWKRPLSRGTPGGGGKREG